MTHSTGIPVSEELFAAFSGGRSPARFITVVISADQLVPSHVEAAVGSESEDFRLVQNVMKPKLPVYVLYRRDNDTWVFLAYSPDGSTVKDRMIYAGTRDNLKRGLGYSHFKEELFSNEAADFTWDHFLDHINKSKDTSSLLTDSERLYNMESQMAVAQGPSKEYVHSVKFPLARAALTELEAMAAGQRNLVQLAVDVDKETIELADQGQGVAVGELATRVSSSEPRFVLFRWERETPVTMFIYSCPSASKIKHKMLYSTVKAVAVGAIEDAGVKVDKKVEIQDGEVTEDALAAEADAGVASAAMPSSTTFAKPARGPGGGARRLIRK